MTRNSFVILLLAAPWASAQDRASDLHRRALVLDTHADTTHQRIYESFDLGARASQGHVDIPRMREGGLDAVFFSIHTRPRSRAALSR